MKKECISNGIDVRGEIDYARMSERCSLLIGIKNADLQPTRVYVTSVGLTLYTCRIRSRVTNNEGLTYCMGGPLALLNEYNQRYGEAAFLGFVEQFAKNVIKEKIPEVGLSSYRVSQIVHYSKEFLETITKLENSTDSLTAYVQEKMQGESDNLNPKLSTTCHETSMETAEEDLAHNCSDNFTLRRPMSWPRFALFRLDLKSS